MSYNYRSRSTPTEGCLTILAIVGLIAVGALIGGGIFYWYTRLWHTWPAANIHYWQCVIVSLVCGVFGRMSKTFLKLLGLLFVVSIVAQVLVWIKVFPHMPIFPM